MKEEALNKLYAALLDNFVNTYDDAEQIEKLVNVFGLTRAEIDLIGFEFSE